MLDTYVFTVAVARCSSRLICRLERPWAISARTSASRPLTCGDRPDAVGELGLGHILEQESARSGLQRLEEVLVRVKAGQDYDPGAEQSVEERDLLQFYPAGPGFAFFGELAGDEAAQLRNVGWQAQASPRPELGHEYVAAGTATERQIVAIWQSSLGMEPIGVLDEFFELGGDSVFANQIILPVNPHAGGGHRPPRMPSRISRSHT